MDKLQELFKKWKKWTSENFLEIIDSHDLTTKNTLLFLNILNHDIDNNNLKYKFYQFVKQKFWENIYQSDFIFIKTEKEKRKPETEYSIQENIPTPIKEHLIDIIENLEVQRIHCCDIINDKYVKKILNNEIDNIGNMIVFFENKKYEYTIPQNLIEFIHGYNYILDEFMPYGYLFLNSPNPPNNHIWHCQEWFPFYKSDIYILVNVSIKSINYGKYAIINKDFYKKGIEYVNFDDVVNIILNDTITLNYPREIKQINKNETYSIYQHIRKITNKDIENLGDELLCVVSKNHLEIILYLTLVSNYETYLYYKYRGMPEIKTSYSIKRNIENLPNNTIMRNKDLEVMALSEDYEFYYDELVNIISDGCEENIKDFFEEKTREFYEKYYSKIYDIDAERIDDYLFDHKYVVEICI